MSFLHTMTLRTMLARSRTTTQRSLRRGYASEPPHNPAPRGSSTPWLIGSLVVAIGGSYMLFKKPVEMPHGKETEKNTQTYHPKSEAQPTPKRTPASASASEPAGDDLPAASKPAGPMTEQSGKQEGWSNQNTKVPDLGGKEKMQSVKAEGEPETAKLKGTVQTDRPQSPPEGVTAK